MTDYRYTLTRDVDPLHGSGRLCWVMLNPSTADDTTDDPTIRRVIRFTRDHGYDRLEVVNLFANRSPSPTELLWLLDPNLEAPDTRNCAEVMAAFKRADSVAFAWGAWWSSLPVTRRPVRPAVAALAWLAGHAPLCLGVTKAGAPRHPLYVPAATRLRPYEGE